MLKGKNRFCDVKSMLKRFCNVKSMKKRKKDFYVKIYFAL